MKVRFAPSPTGFLHIGNARTAVVNHIMARKHGAGYVLRIEDTDRERSTLESEASIIDDLKWLGIEWTEGPDTGGDAGPYRQSERFEIYKKYTEQLLADGTAYPCYCTKEELEASRKDDQGNVVSYTYNGRCRNLSDEEKEIFEKEGRAFTIRFHVPENETVVVKDHLKGDREFKSENIGGDFIIVRSDGVPIYNYIVSIDDTLMGITHVIRGEDHLSNTPKQILVARALGFPEPEYAHQPLIMGEDKKKLSKRHGITSVNLYREEGYLPEALVNYLSLLGWATDSGEEILTEEELVKEFDLNKLGSSAAIFDFKKLRWMNSQYINKYDIAKLTDLFLPYIKEAGYDADAVDRSKLEAIVELIRGSCEVLSDIKNFIGIFLDEVPEPDETTDNRLKSEAAPEIINAAAELFASELTEDNFAEKFIDALNEKTEAKGKPFFMTARALVTMKQKGPDIKLALPLIGFDKVKKRIEFCKNRYC